MPSVLTAFSGVKTREYISDLLEDAGISVETRCGSGAEVLRCCRKGTSGVVLCGLRLLDMGAETLREDLPQGWSMIVLAEADQLDTLTRDDICRLPAPATRSDLVGTVQMLLHPLATENLPPKRSEEEQRIGRQAKALLMERNHMTEEQAHRFLQKRSMDTGARMVQTAIGVLSGAVIE